jgi:hypothetical protein
MSWNRAATGQAHAMGIEYLDGLYSYALVLGNSVSTSFRGSSSMISVACGTHEFLAPTSRSSFRSVRRLMTFDSGSVTGGSYMFTCKMRCIFQLCHFPAERRSAT